MPTLPELQKMTLRFAPAEIGADVSALPANERAALGPARRGGAHHGRAVPAPGLGRQRRDAAGSRARSPAAPAAPRASRAAAARLHYFLINKGPWDRLDHNRRSSPARRPSRSRRTSIRAAPPRPRFRNGSTRSRATRKRPPPASSRRSAAATITSSSCPTASSIRAQLARAAELLREAAQLTADAALKAFLTTRADAFLSNDYYASDVAWMELDGAIEPTIGPYEVYEDEWFNFKAAFEAFITVRDEAETKKLQAFSDHLQDLEDNLPIEPACAIRSSARWRRSASSTRSLRPATATAACRPPPTTSPTTSASSGKRAPSGSC